VASLLIDRFPDAHSAFARGWFILNDQTVNKKFQVPFGGMGSSGNGGRFGGSANLKEFTQTQWVSVMEAPIKYPF
jgi:benzaldehyde dehydrogenase (NAD)